MLDTFFGFVQFVSFVIALVLDRLLSAQDVCKMACLSDFMYHIYSFVWNIYIRKVLQVLVLCPIVCLLLYLHY